MKTPRLTATESISLPFLKSAKQDPKLLKQCPSWLTYIKPVIALAKPKKLAASTMRELLLINQDLGECHGVTITNKHLQAIYTILAMHNKSEYVSSAAKTPEYSSAVPTVMQAYKENWGIEYSRWELDDPAVNAMILGKGLKDIIQVRDHLLNINSFLSTVENFTELGDSEYEDSLGISSKKSYDPFNPKQQMEWRIATTANGTIPTTAYTKLRRKYPQFHPLGNDFVPKLFWCMLTQTWVFDPRLRHPDMITNMLDFDTPAPELESYDSNAIMDETATSVDIFGI